MYLCRQTERKGFQASTIYEALQKAQEGRFACDQKHWSSWTQLSWNSARVEKNHTDQKADIIVLDMPLLDTTKGKDLLGTFIADLVLQLLSFVAENERRNILQRQAEGIAAAKKRGVKFGRPQRKLSKEYAENYKLWKDKKISAREGADNCNMSLQDFYKYGKRIYWFRISLKSIGFKYHKKTELLIYILAHFAFWINIFA